MGNFFRKNRIPILTFLILAGAAVFFFPFLLRWSTTRLVEEGRKAYRAADFDKARKIFELTLLLDPNNSEATSRLGAIYCAQESPEEALRFLEKAVKAYPDNAENYYLEGIIYNNLKDRQKAIQAFRKALQLDPGRYPTLQQLAYLLRKEGRLDEAISLLESVTMKDPKDPDSFMILHKFYVESNDPKKALQVLEKALEVSKPPKQVFIDLLAEYERDGEQEKIDALFQRFLNSYPEDMSVYRSISGYYEDKKNYERAEEVLKSAKNRLDKDPAACYILGDFYRRRNRYKDAISIFEEALQDGPNSEYTYFYLGMTYYDMGDAEHAEEWLLRCLASHQKSPVALNMIAWLYLTSPPGSPSYKPEDALTYAKRAVAISPGSTSFVDTLARAFYANGRYDESIAKYMENVNRGATLPYSYYGLAVGSWKLGREKEAPAYLKKALEMGFKDAGLIRHDLDVPIVKSNARITEILKEDERRIKVEREDSKEEKGK